MIACQTIFCLYLPSLNNKRAHTSPYLFTSRMTESSVIHSLGERVQVILNESIKLEIYVRLAYSIFSSLEVTVFAFKKVNISFTDIYFFKSIRELQIFKRDF